MLRWKTRPRREGETYVVLEGDLTESESLSNLRVDEAQVIFNLARVRYINSEGSRRFLQLLEAMTRNHKVVAELCSPAVVSLLNFVPILTLHLHVHSVIVPLECPDCGAESDARVVIPEPRTIPALDIPACAECGAAMETAVPEERYFAFLAE